tara:strand:- start:604 stop:945 length:342 start_codon:yes stop_codon:yes gene_type:complete
VFDQIQVGRRYADAGGKVSLADTAVYPALADPSSCNCDDRHVEFPQWFQRLSADARKLIYKIDSRFVDYFTNSQSNCNGLLPEAGACPDASLTLQSVGRASEEAQSVLKLKGG